MLWTEDNFVFGQIWKFRFMYTCGIDQSFRVFYPTLDEWKSRFWAQSSQKRDIKKRKNEKMPKNSQFWACFGVFEQLNLVRLNSAVAVKLYFVHILQIKMVGKLKSHEIAWNERIHVYYKTTNKYAMDSRQPDSGLRQYNCTGPRQVVGPTWRKVYKNTLKF